MRGFMQWCHEDSRKGKSGERRGFPLRLMCFGPLLVGRLYPGRVGRAIGVVLLKSEARAYGDLRQAQQRER